MSITINTKVGDEKQHTKQHTEQQTNNKQITTNKNNKNYILINKYKREASKNFYGKLRWLREIKDTEEYKTLSEEQKSLFRAEIMGGRYDV